MFNRVLLGYGIAAVAVLAIAAGGQSGSPSEAAAVRKALRPLQVVVGRWRGNTYRENVVHEAAWAWDHRSDPKQPALVMRSAKNPFFREARLTFEPATETYVLTLTDPAGKSRRLAGRFSEPPEDVIGDDGQSLQRAYELALEQVDPATGEQWRVVLDQQENDRYLVELSKRRGRAPFRGFDTVSGQREGTSFALSDEGYGEKTCVISGGLGTTAVAHAGRTYYVCCSGCEAAFKDDPEKWIAEYEKEKRKR